MLMWHKFLAGAKLSLAAGLLVFLQSCTTSVVVQGTVPVPLVSKIPARVGVFYSEEFKNFRHEETMRDSGSWNIDLGEQNEMFFKSLMSSVFDEVVEIDRAPESSNDMNGLDGIVIPQIEKFGFLTPSVSGLKFYSASIEYRIIIFDQHGEKVGDWNIVGYGKSEGGVFSADEAINEATVLAIRDGGARLAIELIDIPAVRAWSDSLNTISTAPGETSSSLEDTNDG